LCFFTGLWVAAYAKPFVPNRKAAKVDNFYGRSFRQTIRHRPQKILQQLSAFVL
jgi:hypothetical protein